MPSGKATAITCHDGIRIASGLKDAGTGNGYKVILDYLFCDIL